MENKGVGFVVHYLALCCCQERVYNQFSLLCGFSD